MRIRSDVDRIRTFMITHRSESDHYGEMMKNFYRTEKARFGVHDYTGTTLRQWLPRRRAILRQLTEAVGGFPEKKCALNPTVTRKTDRGDYTVEALYFHSRPNWPVSAALYLPKEFEGPLPAIMVVHGHAFTQKAAPVYQKVAVQYVRNGYAVLAVDFVGGGDRLAQKHESRYFFTAGMTVQAVMVWDNMRAVDYLISRPEIDPKRIGVTGSSGGGNQTAYTTIFDERIAASAPVNAVTMFDEHMAVGCDYYCPCEVIPGMWRIAEYSDLIATVAPRPLLLVSAMKDRLFPIKGVREVYYRAREVYRAFDAAGSIDVAEDYGPHSYSSASRAAVLQWFDKHLKGVEPRPLEDYEDYITIEDPRSEVLQAFPDGELPEGSGTLATLYGEVSRKLPDIKRPRSRRTYNNYRRKVRAHLSRLYGDPEEVSLDVERFPLQEASWGTLAPLAFRSERGIIIPSVLVLPRGADAERVVIHANPDGKAATVARRAVEGLVKAGSAVFALDLRSTGETQGFVPSETSEPYGFILNRSIALGRHISMMRAHDIIRAVDCLAALDETTGLPVHLWAEGHVSMAAAVAFALERRIRRLAAAELLLTFRSCEGFVQDDAVFPPHMLLAADVADILAVGVDRPVLLANPEMPSGDTPAPRKAREVLKAAMNAAKILNSEPPEIVTGGFERIEREIHKFLTA